MRTKSGFNYSLSVHTSPYSPAVIISKNSDEVLFFSQEFSRLSGIPAAMVSISEDSLSKLNLQKINSKNMDICELLIYNESSILNRKSVDVELNIGLDHELRTASLLMELGNSALNLNDRSGKLIVDKLSKASQRHKIASLIASDYIQLITLPPKLTPINLSALFLRIISLYPDSSYTRTFLGNSSSQNYLDPPIGSVTYLHRFFHTLSCWLAMKCRSFNIEVEDMNSVSIKVQISFESNGQFTETMVDIPCFSLICHYIRLVASYFNARSWITEHSIVIIFPAHFRRS